MAENFAQTRNLPLAEQLDGLQKITDRSIKPNLYEVDTSKVKLKELGNADGLMDFLNGRSIDEARKELLAQGFDGIALSKRGESVIFPESMKKIKTTLKTPSNPTDPTNYKSADDFVKAQENPISKAQTGKPITAKLYHGSPDARFAEEFDPKKTGYYPDAPDMLPDNTEWTDLYGKTGGGFRGESATGNKGISFTDSKATAKSYSEKPAFDYQNSVPMVLERYVELKNPKVYDLGGKKWDLNMEQEMRKALANGYDGLVFKNILDDYHPSSSKIPANNIIVLDPLAIKTKSQLTEIWNKANRKASATDK